MQAEPPLPLAGRAAVVTGVSRRVGIGFATARRLLAEADQPELRVRRSHGS